MYLCGTSSYEQNKAHGTVGSLSFRGRFEQTHEIHIVPYLIDGHNCLTDGPQSVDALSQACATVETVYVDAAAHDNIGELCQICNGGQFLIFNITNLTFKDKFALICRRD